MKRMLFNITECNLYIIWEKDKKRWPYSFNYSVRDLYYMKPYLKCYNIPYVDICFSILSDDSKFDAFLSTVNKNNNNPNIYLFMLDVYQRTCTGSNCYLKIQEKINQLKQKNGHIIPDEDFILYTASKRYVNDFKQHMVLPTLVYLKDDNEILQLKKDRYVIKYGFTSCGIGVNKIHAPGTEILTMIKNSIDDPSNTCKNYKTAFVQKQTDIFLRCLEFSFMILEDKVVGVVGWQLGDAKRYFEHYKRLGQKLNNKVYQFIKGLVVRLKDLYPNYFFARFDIIIDSPFKNYDSLFDPDFNGDIYLNEIESIGSGWKYETYMIIKDNGDYAQVDEYVYDGKRIIFDNSKDSRTDYNYNGNNLTVDNNIYKMIVSQLINKLI